MKVKFKIAWRNYRVGQVIEPGGVLRDWLIREGFVVPLEDDKVNNNVLTREVHTQPAKKKAKRKAKAKAKKKG